MRLIYLLIFVIFSNTLISQSIIDCGTPDKTDAEMESLPWYGNNQYLFNLLDTLGYFDTIFTKISHSVYQIENVLYRIPIKFWVYRDNNGNGGFTVEEIQAELDTLNSLHRQNNTRI